MHSTPIYIVKKYLFEIQIIIYIIYNIYIYIYYIHNEDYMIYIYIYIVWYVCMNNICKDRA